MPATDQPRRRTDDLVVGDHDILFECPACNKSLVIDENAEGMIVECPQCHIGLIVPPKVATMTPGAPPGARTAEPAPIRPAPPPAMPAVPSVRPDAPAVAALQSKLEGLAHQLRESQTQWTEVTNRIASRINEVNRDLVVMARLETAHKEILKEWNKLVGEIAATSQSAVSSPPAPPKTK